MKSTIFLAIEPEDRDRSDYMDQKPRENNWEEGDRKKSLKFQA